MPADSIAIEPQDAIDATIRPPGSKSITNRALVCAALAQGDSLLRGVLESEDTRVMVESLQKLNLTIRWDQAEKELTISGCGGELPSRECDLFVANSGTTMRFLTAALATGRGRFRLDGVDRMRERPIQDLLDALCSLGSDVVSEQCNRCPPVIIRARGLQGGTATVRGDISSQFLSGLLMATPYAREPVQLIVEGQLVSQPYVAMTQRVMDAFGVALAVADQRRFTIGAPACYQGRVYDIEPDATAASYFWAPQLLRAVASPSKALAPRLCRAM